MRAGRTRSFFEEQRASHQRTLLFLALGLAWVCSLGFWATFVHLVLLGLFWTTFGQLLPGFLAGASPLVWGGWGALAFVALWAGVAACLYWRSGALLPWVVGAQAASGPDRERLARALRELAVASGEPTSEVGLFVWETPAPNAFASGRSTRRGSIVVTRGLLDLLERDELRAVLAHELAHLRNRDTLYVVQAIAFVSTLIAVAYLGAAIATLIAVVTAGLVWLIIKSAAELIGNAFTAVVVAIVASGMVLVVAATGAMFLLACLALFGSLTVVVALGMRCAASAVSQSREYLADAYAAQWTRRPGALASALAKMGGAEAPLPASGALVRPLLLGGGEVVDGWPGWSWSRWVDLLLRSHPPLTYRIATLREMEGTAPVGAAGRVPSAHRIRLRWAEWIGPLSLSAGLIVLSLASIPWRDEDLAHWFPAGSRPAVPASAARRMGFIQGSSVRLRSGPSTSSPVLALLERGAALEMLGEERGRGGEIGWYRVRVHGFEGWVAKRLVHAQP